jgi:hypothetical protein
MVMLRSTEVDPHVTTANPRLDLGRVSGASPRDSGHRGGSPGVTGGPPRPGSDRSSPDRFGSLSCRDYGVQIDQVSRSAVMHSRHPAIRRSPPRWETASVGLVLGDPRGPPPTIGCGAPPGRFRPLGPPLECSTPGPCSADESVALSGHCWSENALSFHGLCSPPRSSWFRRSTAWTPASLPEERRTHRGHECPWRSRPT